MRKLNKRDPLWLFEKMLDEAHELSHAILHARPGAIRKEAADVARYARMIADTVDQKTNGDEC